MTKLIAFDLDGTLAKGYDAWPGPEIIGEPNPDAVALAYALRAEGHKLAVWTCRADHVVRKWLKDHKLDGIFEYINESPYPSDSRKASFDLLIDDKALGWPGVTLEQAEGLLASAEQMGDLTDEYRDKDFCDQNLKVWYQGTGTMFTHAFEEQHQAIWANWKPSAPIALLTICSHAKPYSKSAVHDDIRKYLHHNRVLRLVDYIHISNVGLIPSTHEMEYPWNAYDGNYAVATDIAKRELREGIRRRLVQWFARFYDEYEGVVIYLRHDGNTAAAVRAAIHDVKKDGFMGTSRLSFVEAEKYPQQPWVLDEDPDNTLRREENLFLVVNAINNFLGE